MRKLAIMKKCLFIIAVFLFYSCTESTDSEQELILADRAFSQMSEDEGMRKAFSHYLFDKEDMMRLGRLPIVDDEELLSYLIKVDDKQFQLTWEPLRADTAISGDYGFTHGEYQLKTGDAV